MSPHRKGGGHIVFGVDPIGVDVCVTVSCVHDMNWSADFN